MSKEEKPQFIHEQIILGLTGANVLFGEGDFLFVCVSGQQVRQYLVTPNHAKQIHLLLQKQIAEYEAKFGEIKAQLPPLEGTAPSEGFGFDLKK
jgi:hypothetical protein